MGCAVRRQRRIERFLSSEQAEQSIVAKTRIRGNKLAGAVDCYAILAQLSVPNIVPVNQQTRDYSQFVTIPSRSAREHLLRGHGATAHLFSSACVGIV